MRKMKKKREFSREFKISVVRELESGKSMAQLCREHELHPSLVNAWRRAWQDNPDLAFSGRGRASSSAAKIAEYERLIGRLYAENALLKKALSGLENLVAEHRRRR